MINIKYIKFLMVLFLMVVFIVLVNRLSTKNDIKKIEDSKKDFIAPLDFDNNLASFEKYYKKTLVFSRRGDLKHAQINSKKSLEAWESVYKNFKDKQDSEYINTIYWKKNLEIIYEINIKSNSLIDNKKLNEANLELLKIRIILREMRKENNILSVNDQMLDFYDSFLPVISANKKSETIEYMQDMKLDFLEIKEIYSGQEHGSGIKKIEGALSGIDRLVASDFRDAQKDLLVYFEDLYLLLE